MSENKEISISQKDINRVMRRWYFATELSLNFERMQALAFTYAFLPILKKLYTEKSELKEALVRHMKLFNTNATAGGLIVGLTIAMEEEKARTGKISSDAIVAIKTGLMGPVAAFGDSFSAGTFQTLCILAASTMAVKGSFFALPMLFLGNAILMAELVITTNLTYKKGRDAIKDVLSSKQMRYVLYGANILGMGMMGALSANMVNLQSKLNFGFGKAAINVQENLDKIFPGILTIIVLFLFYYLIGIIIASHGKFAEGMYDAIKMFSGELENFSYISLLPDQDLKSFIEELKNKIDKVDSGDGVVVFCDLLYGTPSNIVSSLLKEEIYKEKLEIISGINLATVLEYTNTRNEIFDRNKLLEVGKSSIASVNDIIEK